MMYIDHYLIKLSSKYLAGFFWGCLFLSGEAQNSYIVMKNFISFLIGYALQKLQTSVVFDKPQHGNSDIDWFRI